MQTLDEFFRPLVADLTQARAAKRIADQQEAPEFTVFRYLNPDENLLSDILADLLNPEGTHGQGPLFLELFLRVAGVNVDRSLEGARIRREDTTTHLSQNRRIDFTVEVGPFGIGVENKPWAGDQADQVADYVRHLTGKYGEGRSFMIYLSGEGTPPSSLSETARRHLEQEGRFKTLPYATDEGVKGWLRSCLEACLAQRVRVFLNDFLGYIDSQFGSTLPGRDSMETDIYIKHALQNETNLTLFLGATKAFEGVACHIISDFTQALTSRLIEELNKMGKGWLVQGEQDWEVITVSREGWRNGEASLRVALAADEVPPRRIYFTVRAEGERPLDSLSDRIAETLDAHCGPGKRDGCWWPYWYRYEKPLTAWSNPDVLLELWRKGDALDHFTTRMLRLAVAVDSAINTKGLTV